MNNKGVILSIGLVIVFLFGISIIGTIQMEKSVSEKQLNKAHTLMEIHKEESRKAFNNIALSSEDKEYFEQLMNLLSKGNLEAAAKKINSHKISWDKFPCMYDGSALRAEVSSGKVLVMTKPSTIFFGNFKEGKPEGQCTALQVLDLEEGKRYDYSVGLWEDGKMNGDGLCGYNYYEGVIGDIPKEIVKKGSFLNDFMQGEITYSSISVDKEVTTWQLQVSKGVIIPDERWIKTTDNSGTVFYQLMAKDDEVHAYTLSESAMKDDRWRNLILYISNY